MKNLSLIRGKAEVLRTYNFPIIFDFDREDGNKVKAEFRVVVTCDDGYFYDEDISLTESTHQLTDIELKELDYEIHDILYSVL